jgi:hypothetical protein
MITLGHYTLRTSLDDWSARCRDLCLTTYNNHKRHIYSPSGIWTDSLSRPGVTDPRQTAQPLGPACFFDLVTKIQVYSHFRFLYPITLIDPKARNFNRRFLRSFGDTASRVFVRKLGSSLVSAPQLCRQEYIKFGSIRLRKYVYVPHWTAASRLQVSSGSISKLNVPNRPVASVQCYHSTLCSSEAVTCGFTTPSQGFSNPLTYYTVRSESRCALIKTLSSIEWTIVSKNRIKQLHTLPVLHFNRCLTSECSEKTAHFNGNFDSDSQSVQQLSERRNNA